MALQYSFIFHSGQSPMLSMTFFFFFPLRLKVILLQYLFYIWGSNTSCQTTGKEEQMCSILIPRFQIKHFIPHTLVKCMCLFIKSGIYIVKKDVCIKKLLSLQSSEKLKFMILFNNPISLTYSKNSKKEHFLTSQRNNYFSDITGSWRGIDTKIEFPCFFLDTPTVNYSCPSTWIQKWSQPSLSALLTPLNHQIFQYKRTTCQGSNYTICFNLISF